VRPVGRILVLLFAAACLAACTEVVDSVVDTRYGDYNRQTDWAKNEAILLNIVRASEYQPLNFLVYSAYTGTATVSAMASAPSFIIGPNRVASQKQYTIGNTTLNATATGTGNITVQNLDTQDFYDALLSPVDFTNLYEFQRQGYPRELLFRLFTDYVSIKSADNLQSPNSFILYNNTETEKQCVRPPDQLIRRLYGRPADPDRDHICFEDLVRFALLSGLSSEVRPIAAPSTSGGGAKPAGAASPTGGTPKPSSTPSPSSSSTTPKSPSSEGRLCFDSALANRAQGEYETSTGQRLPQALKSARYYPVCGTWSSPSTSKKEPNGTANSSSGVQELKVEVDGITGFPVWDIHTFEKHTVEIGTRSTFAMYNFLGQLMRQQDSGINVMIDPIEKNTDRQVLTVIAGQPAGCFVSAMFDLGVYCVPIDGAANTKRTFSILSQLLALKTTTGDLQLQPIFRLLPQ
jgi:hypothetical protein